MKTRRDLLIKYFSSISYFQVDSYSNRVEITHKNSTFGLPYTKKIWINKDNLIDEKDLINNIGILNSHLEERSRLNIDRVISYLKSIQEIKMQKNK